MNAYYVINPNDLQHHGILGQKWGHRNGPPYPLSGGDYSKTEHEAITKARRSRNNIYNKRHFDTVLKEGTELATLSYDKNRTKGADMFFASHTKADQDLYNMMFNSKLPPDAVDANGNSLGTSRGYKFRISNKVMKDMKVASEDTSAEVFRQLYKKDRDFYNYVTDPNRMQKMFVEEKYKFKGYREGKEVLDKLQNKGYTPTDDDLQKVYRLFNYTIPAMGTARETKDVANQRGKFFAEMKKRGYGAILDTNDAIYGSFKGQNPVIAFDMTNIMLNKITDTTIYSKRASTLRTIGRRALGLNNK